MSETLRFVNPLETVLFLRTLPLLQGVGYDGLGLLARQAKERHFKRGSRLLDPDRAIASFFIVVDGEVRVTRDEVTEMIARSGDNIGFLYFLARVRRGVEAVALAETHALEFDSRSLLDVFEDHFSILRAAVRNISQVSWKLVRDSADGAYKAPREGAILPDRTLDLVERIDLMRRSDVFQRASVDALAQMAMSMRETRLPPGEKLWSVGDPSGHLYMLLSGQVTCGFDKGARSFRAGPGYPLGNVENLAGLDRWYDAVADTEVRALRAETNVFLDILEDHFDLALEFLQASALNILQYMNERAVLASRVESTT
jgi:CRP-like cAMP-binding protein